jgi:hypothetical protein
MGPCGSRAAGCQGCGRWRVPVAAARGMWGRRAARAPPRGRRRWRSSCRRGAGCVAPGGSRAEHESGQPAALCLPRMSETNLIDLDRWHAWRASWRPKWLTRRPGAGPPRLTIGSCAAWAEGSRISSCAPTTSRWGAWGLVAVEGMSASRPVLSSQLVAGRPGYKATTMTHVFRGQVLPNPAFHCKRCPHPHTFACHAPPSGMGGADDSDAVRVAGGARRNGRRRPRHRQRGARQGGRRLGTQCSVPLPKARRDGRNVAGRRGAAAAGTAGEQAAA